MKEKINLRDYFAAKAMQADYSNNNHGFAKTAEYAYKMADAMIKEREKWNEEKKVKPEKPDVPVNVAHTDFEKKVIEFFNFRIKIKKPMIEESKAQFLAKLNKLSNGSEKTAIDILNQSIANGWQGIFELKTTNNGTKHHPLDSLHNAAISFLEQTGG